MGPSLIQGKGRDKAPPFRRIPGPSGTWSGTLSSVFKEVKIRDLVGRRIRSATFGPVARRPRPLGARAPGVPKATVSAALLLLAVLLTLGCSGGREATQDQAQSRASRSSNGQEIVSRFLLGGWLLPKNVDSGADPFAETLKAFVITTEEELREFLDGVHLLRPRGNRESLNRTDLSRKLMVAVYYLWRPLKGDPLSLEKTVVNGTEVEVQFELLADPQGRESPFLLAPLYIAALDKEHLPLGVPIRFAFLVNGELAANRAATLE